MDWAVRGFNAGGGDVFILLNVKADTGAHPASCSVDNGNKWSRREINYSPAYGTELKNKWNYTSSPPIRFHGVQKENFTFSPTT